MKTNPTLQNNISQPVKNKINIDDLLSQRDYLLYSKQVHHYSPAVHRLLDLSDSYIADAEHSFATGEKKAIWTGNLGWEVPLLYSFDTIPVAYSEMGRLSDREAMQTAEDYYQFPVETCSMVKCTVGQWHRRRHGPGIIKRIMGNSSACEPYNMAWEIMKKEGFDVFTTDIIYRGPGVDGERLEKLITFFIEQVYRMIEWLNGNRDVNEARLLVEIRRRNRILDKVRKIIDLRIKRPYYIKSLPAIFLINIGMGNYYGKPEEFEETLDELIDELENAPRQEDEDREVIPLVWGYGTGQEFGIYEAIDQAGGALLGFRGVPFKNYREDLPPIDALARYIYENQSAGAGIYVRNVIEQEIKKISAKGLILYGYIGCSFASIDKEMWRSYFHELGIPSISLEGSFQTGAPTGQLMTRIKAFIEMLS